MLYLAPFYALKRKIFGLLPHYFIFINFIVFALLPSKSSLTHRSHSPRFDIPYGIVKEMKRNDTGSL
jgi:hypothetical protein